jgi:hypothetical protein
MRFPGSCVATPSSSSSRRFRLRLEAQHGWQFDHSWPTEPECTAATFVLGALAAFFVNDVRAQGVARNSWRRA